MTRIERIQPSLHKKDRVLVYLTGGDLLRITPEELLRFGLRPGQELTEDVLEELRRAAARSQTRQRAAELAAGRMLSRKELSDRLVKKGAAQWLADLGAVDDAAYAGVIARHYAAMGYGPGRVRQELQRRGVPRDLWEDALAQLPDPEEAIDKFLAAKLRGKTPDRATLQRLSAALQRRGFQWQDIRPGPGHGGMSSRWRRKQSPAGDTPAAFNTRIIRGNRA